ncbi:hypothetical protein T03_9003 [Trichinella britovi]|uniref:Uncharacterized protein n=1 Tax=Trichinella britovi TaxID=45882 RepID=A0A0V1D6B3_TRIBR|nr:hypothetical protein T03_9003 [Trichinella britovi]
MKTKKTEATGELASCQPIPARRQIAMDAPIPRWKKRTSLLEAAARYMLFIMHLLPPFLLSAARRSG